MEKNKVLTQVLTQVLDEKMENSFTSDISDVQIAFALCQRKDGENFNDRKGQYKLNDREKDHRITEFYTRLYKIPFESHVQGCTEEHVLLDKDKLNEIINSVISSELRKKFEETILLHSSIYELIVPDFKCHGFGFYHDPDTAQEIFNKNLSSCYYETCPMYVKNVDSFKNSGLLKKWDDVDDDEKEIFAQIALCAKKVFQLMYPHHEEIAKDMKLNNLDFTVLFEFDQRETDEKSKLFDVNNEKDKSIFTYDEKDQIIFAYDEKDESIFTHDEKDQSIFTHDEKDKSVFTHDEKDKNISTNNDRREKNLKSIHRCSQLLDNLSDTSNKEKKESQNYNLDIEAVEQRLLLLQPQFNSLEPRNKIGKRFIVTFILSLFLVITTSFVCYFLDN